MQQDMQPDSFERRLRQQTEICDDCDKAPLTGCIRTWFPSWFLNTKHEPTHRCADRDGNLTTHRYAKRCPQFTGKKIDANNPPKRFGFVVITGDKK